MMSTLIKMVILTLEVEWDLESLDDGVERIRYEWISSRIGCPAREAAVLVKMSESECQSE